MDEVNLSKVNLNEVSLNEVSVNELNKADVSIGAIVTAAGRSSRMGGGLFKPLLKIGGLTAAERVVFNFLAAGVGKVVLVTGNRAEELEDSLKRLGVIFLRNDLYERTEMFDSVKIGLAFLKDTCRKIFLTPADVPLFTADTVKKLLLCETDVGVPTHLGETGHPIVLNGRAAHDILGYAGSGGMKGAITRLSLETAHIEVNDSGILYDMDTQADYARILKLCAERPALDAPSADECLRLLERYKTPEPVVSHCRAVSRKALQIADSLDSSCRLDRALIQSAALLHDAARAEADHSLAGCRFLLRCGYPRVADIILSHHHLKAEDLESVTESTVVFYADKLLCGTDEVTVGERFSKSRRQCTTPEARASHRLQYEQALRAQALIYGNDSAV